MGLSRYPGSRFFTWGIADSYFKMEDYANAIPVYEEILNSVMQTSPNNRYNETVCLLKLSQASSKQKEHEKAFHYSDRIIGTELEKSVRGRLKQELKKADEIRQKSLEALGRIKVIIE